MQERILSVSRIATEWEMLCELHDLPGKQMLDLGCGGASLSMKLAETHQDSFVLAIDVDRTQIERHRAAHRLVEPSRPNLEFGYGGAAEIPAPDRSFDLVFLFKSLHHVPTSDLDRAWSEIARVLRPRGLVHVSEPVFAGDFNEILSLFHDESQARRAAFESIERAANSQAFHLESEVFYLAPRSFADFDDFRRQIIDVTHTQHQLSERLLREVSERFQSHVGTDGARFLTPQRIDLLRRSQQ